MPTLTDEIYQKLYEAILTGNFLPDQKLAISELAKTFNVALSPVREALTKLTSTGFVTAISQKGFKVASLSLLDFKDLYHTRRIIEKEALKLSIEKGDANWEAELLAAFHRLSSLEKNIKQLTTKNYQEWEKVHRAFNFALISACGLSHLLQMQSQLYHQTERYRRLWVNESFKNNKSLRFFESQEDIMKAALARKSDSAAKKLEEHYLKAEKIIEKVLIAYL